MNSPSGSRPTLQRDTWLWDDMSLNSSGGSTLQCGRWLWDGMPLISLKRLQNGTIFNDLERPLTQISRSHHYLTLNSSEMIRDTDIVTITLVYYIS